MADLAAKQTDKDILKLEKQIHSVFSEAQKDVEAKMQDFNRRWEIKEAIHRKELDEGKITEEQFNWWRKGQEFQSKQWEAKRDQIVHTINNANRVAVNMINGQTTNVFTYNANYTSYSMEHSTGINFGFGLFNNASVTRLIKDNPQMLPKWKIDEAKDYRWNEKKVNNAINQGIIQGESLDKITKRLSKGLAAQNENTMKTFARTAMTGAQNAGRLESMRQAQTKGINVYKQWMATLDSHTRDSHAEVDGESVPLNAKFSNGLEYPGEPGGAPAEVYNCRCTMVSDVKDYPAEYKRYDNINGKSVSNMTYREWERAKGYNFRRRSSQTPVVVDSFQSALGKAKTVEEINVLMDAQGWWRDKQWGVEEANLTGCDLDSAKSIAASYEQVFEKYPQLKGKLDAPNAQPVNMKENTYAWCYLKQNGRVQVNPKKYGDWQDLMRQYEKDVVSGFHPYGTTAESIVTHEIGHAIDGLLAREGILGGVTTSGEYRLASSSLKNIVMKKAAEQDETIAKYWNAKDWNGKADKFWQSYAVEHNVSRYATKNNKEWFAECFAEYITSASPRTVSKLFGKELEKLLGRLQ